MKSIPHISHLLPVVLAVLVLPACGPTSSVGAEDDPGTPLEILEKVLDRYRAMEAFQCTMTVESMVRVSGDDTDRSDNDLRRSVLFKAPDRLRILSEQLHVFLDQERAWVHLPQSNRYVELGAPENPSPVDLIQEAGFFGMKTEPVLDALCRRDATLRELARSVTWWKGVRAFRTNGMSYVAISGDFEPATVMLDQPLPFTIILQRDSWLVDAIEIDTKATYQSMFESALAEVGEEVAADVPQIEEAYWRIRYSDIQIDEEVNDEPFVFVPPDGAEQVESLMPDFQSEADQLRLVGKPAHLFEGEDLEGTSIRLAEFKGKVVLLYFWATWRRPCVQAIPHVQRLSVTYADKGVVVVGVNLNTRDAEEVVRQFLAKKKITFRQFMDVDGAVAEAYAVNRIPCTVLIDKEGVVQWIKRGHDPGVEEEVAGKIETLLTGKSIYDAGEMEAQIAREEESGGDDVDWRDDEEEDADETNAVIEAISEQRLVQDGKTDAGIRRYDVREIDLDGDGKDEIVGFDGFDGINVVRSDGTLVESVSFRRPSLRAMISSFAPVRRGEERCWLVSFAKYHMSFASMSVVYFCDSEGERLWSYDPELGPELASEIMVDTGDLDGDGTDECVIVMGAHKVEKLDKRGWSHSSAGVYLGIFDLKGNVLSMKRIGRESDFLRVVTSGDSETATILVDVDGTLRRYHYDPSIESDPVVEAP